MNNLKNKENNSLHYSFEKNKMLRKKFSRRILSLDSKNQNTIESH